MMLTYTSINRLSSKAVGVWKGGLKYDKNDLSPAVQKILAIKCLLWGIKYSNIFRTFLYVLLSFVTKLFAFTNIILSFRNYKTSYDVDIHLYNRLSSKAVGVCKGGGVKYDKNDLSPAVQKIKAIKYLLWGIKYSNIFRTLFTFNWVLLRNYLRLLTLFRLSQITRHLMGAMMLMYTSINRSSFKTVRVHKGGLKIDKNDLSPSVQKI